MNQTELEAAIELANEIFNGRRYVAPAVRQESTLPLVPETSAGGVGFHQWPSECRGAHERFAQPHAKLFPFVGWKVRTPSGAGTLLQVFSDRVTVILDSQLSKCTMFRPDEIEPLAWQEC